MKKILLAILTLVSAIGFTQGPPSGTYTPINTGQNFLRSYFRSTNITVGQNPVLQTNQWNGAGGLYVDSTGGNAGFYYYMNGTWIRLADSLRAFNKRPVLTKELRFPNMVYDWYTDSSKFRSQEVLDGTADQYLRGEYFVRRKTPINRLFTSVLDIPSHNVMLCGSHTGTSPAIIRSTDRGVTWDTINTPAVGIRSLAYGNGVVVAAGNSGAIIYSLDLGLTWTAATSGITHTIRDMIWSEYWQRFILVANTVGFTNKVLTSPDGITWTQRTCPDNAWSDIVEAKFLGYRLLASATGGGGQNGGKVMYSDDGGETWTSSNTPYSAGTNNVGFEGIFVAEELKLVVITGFAAVASIQAFKDSMIGVSSDGGLNFGLTKTPKQAHWLSGDYSPKFGKAVVVCDDSVFNMMTSRDMYNWTLDTMVGLQRDLRRIYWGREKEAFYGVAYYDGSGAGDSLYFEGRPVDISQQYLNVKERFVTQTIESQIRLPNAPLQGDSSLWHSIVRDAAGNIGWINYWPGGGGGDFWALEGVSTLLDDVDIGADGHTLTFTNGNFNFNALATLNLNSPTTTLSGAVEMTGIAGSHNAADSMMVWNPTLGNVGYRPIPTGGGTPAGNNGNVQINWGSAFATPGSDSLDWDNGLKVKGGLFSTLLTTGQVAFVTTSGQLTSSSNWTWTGSGATTITGSIVTTSTGTFIGGVATSGAISSNHVSADAGNFYVRSGSGGSSTTISQHQLSGVRTGNRVTFGGSTSYTMVANDNFAAYTFGSTSQTEAGSGTHAYSATVNINPTYYTNAAAALTDVTGLRVVRPVLLGGSSTNPIRAFDVDTGILYVRDTAAFGTKFPTEVISVNGNLRFHAIGNVSTADSALFIEDGVVKAGLSPVSGTTTPTITGIANVNATSSPVLYYTRIGNIVTYSLVVNIDPTAPATETQFTFSLPIASAFTVLRDLTGTVTGESATYTNGIATADATGDTGFVEFTSIGTSDHVMMITGHYIIK